MFTFSWYSTGAEKQQKKWERLGGIHHVDDSRWAWGARRGKGPKNKTTHWIIRFESLPQLRTPVVEITHLDQQYFLLSLVYTILEYQAFPHPPSPLSCHPIPPHPLHLHLFHVHLHDECSQAFPSFCRFPNPLYYCDCKWRVRLEETWEWGYPMTISTFSAVACNICK